MARACEENEIPLQQWLDRLRAGDEDARDQLIRHACARLRRLARKMLRDYPDVRRWEQTDDVLQNALIRLYRYLLRVQPESVRHFVALAARVIRSELIDMARHYYGPQGPGARHHSDPEFLAHPPAAPPGGEEAAPGGGTLTLGEWGAFHEAVERLPEEERELVNCLFYQQFDQRQTAEILDVSVSTVKRRWRSARTLLRRALRYVG
jgi:RNA polymerase sigma-70 factor (ECF subfamily)